MTGASPKGRRSALPKLAWAPLLTLFEKGNDDERDDRAIELICGPLGDAITIALDRLGWKIVPQHPSDNDRWVMHEPSPLRPAWADKDKPTDP